MPLSGKLCQLVPGRGVDQAISRLAVQALTPEAIDAAVAVFEELQRRNAELAALYQSQVERARHEAKAAQRQFFLANPENRLVADNLEKRWNDKLRALTLTFSVPHLIKLFDGRAGRAW